MIDRQRYQTVIECDHCADAEESEKGESFVSFWGRLSRDGWTAKKIGSDVFVHTCGGCNK